GEHADEGHLDLVVQLPQAAGVHGGLERVDQAVDGKSASAGDGGGGRGGAVEVELTLTGGVALVGDLGAGVADDHLLEDVAAVGRVDEVTGEGGVEGEAAHVDVEAGEGPHHR